MFKRRLAQPIWAVLVTGVFLIFFTLPAAAFEGHIRVVAGPPGAMTGLLYTVGTNCLRVEMTDTNFPNAIDIVDFGSGEINLIQPMNRTFVRFTPGMRNRSGLPPGIPGGPGGSPPGIGPRVQPGSPAVSPAMPPGPPPGIGATNFPGMPAIPAMPMPPGGLPPGVGPQARSPQMPGTHAMPAMPAIPQNPGMGSTPPMPMIPPDADMVLQATGDETNLINYPCKLYEIKQRGETMEIWATDQLAPFQTYLPHQPPSFGPRRIEQQWSGLLFAKKLFPLNAVLRADNGVERYRFEVQAVTPERLTRSEVQGFQPPDGYVEIPARPF